MRKIEINRMESIDGGNDLVNGLCITLGAGSVVYTIGAATNWWNPVGWVSAAFLVADGACILYAADQVIGN
jgi:hypothetical protein